MLLSRPVLVQADSSDLQKFRAKKNDVVVGFDRPEGMCRFDVIRRVYFGEHIESDSNYQSARKDLENLSSLLLHRLIATREPPVGNFHSTIDLDERDSAGRTPLHRAVRGGDQRWARWLVDNGAEIDARDLKGMTPLHAAATHDADGSLTQILLDSGADKHILDEKGQSPLHLASRASPNLKLLKLFLKCYDDDFIARHVDFNGDTCLHLASDDDWVVKGRIDELIHFGADVDARNRHGQTPLHRAVWGQRSDLAYVLIKHGADVNAVDIFGQTVLLCHIGWFGEYLNSAVGNCELSPECYQALPVLLRMLVAVGADVLIRGHHGASPLTLALQWYLEWTANDVFERENWKSSPCRGRLHELSAREPPQVDGYTECRRSGGSAKLPIDVKNMWLKEILPILRVQEQQKSRQEQALLAGKPSAWSDCETRGASYT